MTNGEKIQQMFPNAEINYGLRGVVVVTFIHKTIFDLDWWNAEYQEPTTKIRPKGHWIEERNDYGEIEHWHCSNCYDDSGFTTTCKWDFCPNCGADMREVEDDNN